MSGIALYFRFITVSFKVQTRYPASFILYSLNNFLVSILELVGIWALFNRFNMLGQWSLGEVMLFYGMSYMAFAMAEAYMRGFDTFHRQVKNGGFDRILTRPRGTFVQVLGLEFQLLRIGRFLNGLIPFIWGVNIVKPCWGALDWTFIVVSIIAGSLTYGGVMLFRAMTCFFTIESLEVFNIFTHGGVECSSYPMNIYTGWLRDMFTFLIPLAAINYLPMSVLLNKGYVPDWVAWISPVFGGIFFCLGYLGWRFGVRHYRSTGS